MTTDTTWRARTRWMLAGALVALVGLPIQQARAGAKIPFGDDVSIDVGLRVQAFTILSQADRDGDGSLELDKQFKVRRARLRLGLDATKYLRAFMQTEAGSADGGSGLDMRIIDAWAQFKPFEQLTFLGGLHMAPASRQNLTGSAAMLTIDRPNMAFKTLSWGTRAYKAFTTTTNSATDSGIRTPGVVRDTGVTVFGLTHLTSDVHMKYYLGAYEGIQAGDGDTPRVTGRVQVNVFDPEPGYFNSSTYLGMKKTVGIGASVDWQPGVAQQDDGSDVDYLFIEGDAFVDWPVGPGAISFEAGFQMLSLDDAMIDTDGDPTTAAKDGKASQGMGFYGQAGWYQGGWQPWIGAEMWMADADAGNYTTLRAGVTWYLKGHVANIKLGYELMLADEKVFSAEDDTLHTVLLGFFTNL